MNKTIIIEDVNNFIKNKNFSQMYGKTLMLTGGTGLLGSYFIYSIKTINERIRDKIEVFFVVHNGIPKFLSFIENCEWIQIIRGDISDARFCESLPQVDYIIHAAGYGQPGMFMDDKVKTLQINTTATDLLLQKLHPDGRFLFISSSEIYSGSEETPYKEDDFGCTTPQHKRACYIEGKRCGEAICMAYSEKGVDVKIARVSLAYGPCFKQNDKRVIYDFIQKARNKKIELLDKGQAQRVYCYISDAMDLLWDIFLEGNEIVYNVGGDSKTTIYHLAEKIAEEMNADVVIPDDEKGFIDAPKIVYMSIDKARNEFGKKTFISLEDGIARTVRWYKEEYEV